MRISDWSSDVCSSDLTAGLFSGPAYDNYSRLIVDRAYDNVGFTATLALKDVNLALAAGEALQVPLPSAMVCRDRLMSAVPPGNAEKDWSVMALDHARASGLGHNGDKSLSYIPTNFKKSKIP